jgi:hypothetical protein
MAGNVPSLGRRVKRKSAAAVPRVHDRILRADGKTG